MVASPSSSSPTPASPSHESPITMPAPSAEPKPARLKPIWTFVHPDGTNLHLDVQAIRSKVSLNPTYDSKIGLCPVDWEIAIEYLHNNIVSMPRVEELAKRYAATGLSSVEPILLCERNTKTNGAPDVYHVDGHHRYVLWAFLKLPMIQAYLLPFQFWQPFRIHGLLPITLDELRAMPVTKRNY